MDDLAINLLSSAAVSSVLSSALVFLARNWISERLRQSIQHEYAQKLEAHKAALKGEHEVALEKLRFDAAKARAMQDVATGSFQESHRESQQRRLLAIQALWDSTLRIRAGVPTIVGLQDVLLLEEYPKVFSGDVFQGSLDGITDEVIVKLMTDTCRDVESSRPFVGERLWSLFFMYRAVVGRFCMLVVDGKEGRKIVHWSEDPGVRQLLDAVLTPTERAEIYKSTVSGFSNIRTAIEAKMLDAAARIISGEEASGQALEQARKIEAVVHSVESQNRRGGPSTS